MIWGEGEGERERENKVGRGKGYGKGGIKRMLRKLKDGKRR